MNLKKMTAVLLAAVLSASALTGCGINKNATAASMNGTKVTLGMANFMCRFEQAEMDDIYRMYFGDDCWQSDLYGSGSTMEDTTKEDVMDQIHDLYTLADTDHMAEYGVELTDDDTAAIQEAAEKFMAANSEDTLKEMGATEELAEEMLRLFTIKSKMHAAIIAEADTEVSDEEANMRAYSMVSASADTDLSGIEYTEDIESTEGTEITGSTEEAETAEIIGSTEIPGGTEEIEGMESTEEDGTAAIEAVMEELRSEAESGEDFETAAEALGLTVTTGTYDADDTSLDENVKTALDGLKEGEYSDLITAEDGTIYLVRLDSECDEEATESNRESIIATRQSDHYDEILSGWQEDDGWTVNEKQIAKISFRNLFTQTADTAEVSTTADTEITGTEITEIADTEITMVTEIDTESTAEAVTENTSEAVTE